MLQTARLTLRPHRPEDLAALHEMDTDAEARHVCGGVADVTTTRNYLDYSITAWGQGYLWKFALDLTSGPPMVGWCWLKWCLPLESYEVGYQIARPFWGQGLATEAARRVVQWAFEKQRLTQVYFVIDPQNTASCRVAEKLGLSLLREQTRSKGVNCFDDR